MLVVNFVSMALVYQLPYGSWTAPPFSMGSLVILHGIPFSIVEVILLDVVFKTSPDDRMDLLLEELAIVENN